MSVKYPNYVNLTSSSKEQPNERTPSPPPRNKSLSPPQALSKSISSKSTHYTSSLSPSKEIFMLVEKDYPLRNGLALVMISYRLQVENHSQMAEDLIKKIYNIANTLRKQSYMAAGNIVLFILISFFSSDKNSKRRARLTEVCFGCAVVALLFAYLFSAVVSNFWSSMVETTACAICSTMSSVGVPAENICDYVSSVRVYLRTMEWLPTCEKLEKVVGGSYWLDMMIVYCQKLAGDHQDFADRVSRLIGVMNEACSDRMAFVCGLHSVPGEIVSAKTVVYLEEMMNKEGNKEWQLRGLEKEAIEMAFEIESLFLKLMDEEPSHKHKEEMELESTQTSSAAKLPMLKKGDYEISNSTNEVSTAYGVSTASTQFSTASTQFSTASTKVSTANLSDATVYAFLSNQSNRQLRNQDSRSWNQDSSRRTVNVEETPPNAMVAIDGVCFDWSNMTEDEFPTNMALMTFSDSGEMKTGEKRAKNARKQEPETNPVL
uniref:Uncharacterized protein n=1 Tax=Tanacetum cinerariifolium TaxID=118510 RepID=A0A6L2P381_TANCI|nr:hypothetical protein [Tanacetum cinerariifolium]